MPGVQVMYPHDPFPPARAFAAPIDPNIQQTLREAPAAAVSLLTMQREKPQVLVCGTLVHSRHDFESHVSEFELLWLSPSTTRAQFLRDLTPGGRFSRITAMVRTNDSSDVIGAFDAELIRALPPTLRAVCHNGAGYDMIDVTSLSQRKIQLSNTPKPVSDATATDAVYLILSALRGFSRAERVCRDGNFKKGLRPGNDPEGKVLGIVGMGGIGRAIALRALGFSMRIIYHNRRPLPPSLLDQTFPSCWRDRITYCSTLDELLAKSDVVSLSMPLNEHTRGSFGRDQFNRMRDGAVFVNTARGAIVQEDALLEALDSGKISSAGLDVFCNEPNPDPRLLSHPRITALPHMGTETVETQYRMEMCAIENALKAARGELVRDLVHEQDPKTILWH